MRIYVPHGERVRGVLLYFHGGGWVIGEGEAYAESMRAAGVDVTATRYDGMIHGFLWTLGATPSGARLIDDAVASLRPAPGG